MTNQFRLMSDEILDLHNKGHSSWDIVVTVAERWDEKRAIVAHIVELVLSAKSK